MNKRNSPKVASALGLSKGDIFTFIAEGFENGGILLILARHILLFGDSSSSLAA